MSSLHLNLKTLEEDLVATPLRISAYHDLPFAIFRYDPSEEFELRSQLRLFAFGLERNHGKRVRFISLAEIVWKAAAECQGLEYLYKVEQMRGFDAAQTHLHNLLSSPDFRPISDELVTRLEGLAPEKDIVFLVRAGAFAPGIYRCSVLLDELHHCTMIPVIFFYPGSATTAADLGFYNLPVSAGLGVYSYRVKVYGVQS